MHPFSYERPLVEPSLASDGTGHKKTSESISPCAGALIVTICFLFISTITLIISSMQIQDIIHYEKTTNSTHDPQLSVLAYVIFDEQKNGKFVLCSVVGLCVLVHLIILACVWRSIDEEGNHLLSRIGNCLMRRKDEHHDRIGLYKSTLSNMKLDNFEDRREQRRTAKDEAAQKKLDALLGIKEDEELADDRAASTSMKAGPKYPPSSYNPGRGMGSTHGPIPPSARGRAMPSAQKPPPLFPKSASADPFASQTRSKPNPFDRLPGPPPTTSFALRDRDKADKARTHDRPMPPSSGGPFSRAAMLQSDPVVRRKPVPGFPPDDFPSSDRLPGRFGHRESRKVGFDDDDADGRGFSRAPTYASIDPMG